MAASQPNRFVENLESADAAPSNAPELCPATGAKAPVIQIERPEVEGRDPQSQLQTDAANGNISLEEPSPKQKLGQWIERNLSRFWVDLIAMAIVIALLPFGALFLVRTNRTFPKSLEKPSAKIAASASSAKTRMAPSAPGAQNDTVLASQKTVIHKPDHTAVVFDVRYTSDSASAVVVVDLDQETQYDVHRLSSPDRIYLDLQNTRLAPVLVGKEIQTQDRLLRALRVGEHERQTTRITLATAQACDYSVKRVQNSSQLRIELRKAQAQRREDKSSTVARN